MHRVSAGPYMLAIPTNGVAILFEDGKQLAGGVGYLDALVQFAGEVIRLNAEIAVLRDMREAHIRMLTANQNETRTEALEEAARVALRWQNEACGEFDRALAIAAAIRALGEPK